MHIADDVGNFILENTEGVIFVFGENPALGMTKLQKWNRNPTANAS